jgi:integrase
MLKRYEASLPEGPTRAQNVRIAGMFLDWLEDRELSAENVRKWQAKRRREKLLADGTIHHEFSILRRLFVVNGIEWPFRRGEAPVVHESEVYAPALDSQDIAAMVNVVLGREEPQGKIKPAPVHKAFLCLSTVWGLRRVEMAEMRPEFLDTRNGMLFVQTAKKGRQRWHIVPDYIMPHLEEWGFRQPLNPTQLSALFSELKGMIGLDEPEVGWHSIRRSAVMEAYRAGLSEAEIYSFYRWKRSTFNMPLRYATSKVVSRSGVRAEVADEDRKIDQRFLELHPFPKLWLPQGKGKRGRRKEVMGMKE